MEPTNRRTIDEPPVMPPPPPPPPTGAGPEPAPLMPGDRARHLTRGVVGTVTPIGSTPQFLAVVDDFGDAHVDPRQMWAAAPAEPDAADVDVDVVAVYARAFGFLEHAVATFLKDWQRYASNPARLTNAVNTLRMDLSDARAVTRER